MDSALLPMSGGNNRFGNALVIYMMIWLYEAGYDTVVGTSGTVTASSML